MQNLKQTNKNKFIITIPHKCGSSVFQKILAVLSHNKKLKSDCDKKILYEVSLKNGQKIEVAFSRHPKVFLDTDGEDYGFIFILRNPIALCISMFYSFGYTHVTPGNQTEEEFQKRRLEIQQLGLEKFVDSRLERECNKIERIMKNNKETSFVLPYELMISRFDSFLISFLAEMGAEEHFDRVYNSCKDWFSPISDCSEDIVNNNLKTHKRTTDIHEWKKKIPQEQINKHLLDFPFIQEYLVFLDTFLE